MEFRIDKRDSFQIVGLSGYDNSECKEEDRLTSLWREFMDNYNTRLWNGGGKDNYYSAPFWQVGAYDFQSCDGKMKAIIGAEYKGRKPDGMAVKAVPSATWAVFTFTSPTGIDYVPAAYTRIITEWFPASQYKRDETVQSLEVFPMNSDASSMGYQWEIWMPVKSK